ncbi:protein FAM53B-like isoform X2 [Takifugu flavidus]|uniref:protein FAM53B-like isoform X2 n=1 Tax=Takifugu flavidus TaxID=433684 RepID=UPI002543FEA4|nr:protein FAM53B-like isoform X2 [Takifugu flavidus]
MVIIFLKTLEKKKGVSDVRSKIVERQLRDLHTMSRGTTLFSRGTVDAESRLDLWQTCSVQQRVPCRSGTSLESLWDVVPEPASWNWAKDPGSATAITSLIQDLSLGDSMKAGSVSHNTCTSARYSPTAPSQAPTAPPSKRQCRSLSFSDEFSGFRSSWKPQGSRVWTTVEKRRCHSGGSVKGGGGFSSGHFPIMQRSSSFSLPSRSSISSDGSLDLTFFNRLPPYPEFTASPISLPEHQVEEASEASSPDSTPELGRRASQRPGATRCLSRSRSQPCVLNDKKTAMKRRRPEDAQEQRPSLDLAKMTQKLQTFQSLSCPGFSSTDGSQSDLLTPTSRNSIQSDFTALRELGLESRRDVARDDEEEEEEDSSYEDLDSDSACSVDSRPRSPVSGNHTLWKGDRGTQRDIFQLGGELDLDQIERN